MKCLFRIVPLAVLALACMSCVDDIKEKGEDVTAEASVQVVLPQLLDGNALPDTKTVWSGSAEKLVWSQNDTIGVIPSSGSPIYFVIDGDAAGKDAVMFKGGGWKLNPSTEYYSFYPFCADMHMQKESIPYTVIGQKQAANGVFNADGYDCLFAKGSTDASSSVVLNYSRLCCFLHITATLPSDKYGTYKKLLIRSRTDNIPVNGIIDATADKPSIFVPDSGYSDKLEIELNDFEIKNGKNVIDVYVAFIPASLDVSFDFTFINDKGTGYVASKDIVQTLKAGTVYDINISSDKLMSDQELFVDSLDEYGLYKVSTAETIITYVPGKDMYSVVDRTEGFIFRIMNPSASSYKFISLEFTPYDFPERYVEDYKYKLHIYAPDNKTLSGDYSVATLYKLDNSGKAWFRLYDENDVQYIIVAKIPE